jgi:hypothetical protein
MFKSLNESIGRKYLLNTMSTSTKCRIRALLEVLFCQLPRHLDLTAEYESMGFVDSREDNLESLRALVNDLTVGRCVPMSDKISSDILHAVMLLK